MRHRLSHTRKCNTITFGVFVEWLYSDNLKLPSSTDIERTICCHDVIYEP
jgi:hypothetical protein